MLNRLGRSGYRALTALAVLLLAACSSKPVLHEFPRPFAVDARPLSAVSYTLREVEPDSGNWALRGGQGDWVGGFRWQRAFDTTAARDAGPRGIHGGDDLFQDGLNQSDYRFRIGAANDPVGWGSAPPRIAIFNAASGEQVGELELRTGFDARIEGFWRGRRILWHVQSLPETVVPRETDEGDIEDHYPAAQVLQWTGGSNAGLRIYSGRAVTGEPPAFAGPVFDIASGRPLTRRELGDAVVLLFAIRALEQAVGMRNKG